MGRSLTSGPGDEQRRRSRHRAGVSDVVWDLSAVLGRIAVGILCLLLIVVVIRQSPTLKKRMASVLPRAIAEMFDDAPRGESTTFERGRSGAVDRTLDALQPQDAPSAPATRRFGVGATKEQVLAVQGNPSRRTDNTWYYGQSEIYFASDRVVGWKSSSANPLLVR